MSSTVTQRSHDLLEAHGTLVGRNVNRARGWAIAIGASLAIWGGIGAAIWGMGSLLG